MRLFSYYALHAFKNQMKKLFKTWVLIFFLVCVLVGVVAGVIAGGISNAVEDKSRETITQTEIEEEAEEETFFEAVGVETNDFIELLAGGIMIVLFVIMALGADKSGSKIFLPADVNLLFASPMKPQSVLMFRLATSLGMSILCSFYLLFQLPNLILNAGMSPWAALALIVAWCLTVVLGTLIQVLLYTLSSVYPAVKRFLRVGIYGLLVFLAAGYGIVLKNNGGDFLLAAAAFFNGKITRYIPIWGWLKGFCGFAMEGNAGAALLSLAAVFLSGVLLVYGIWQIKADFYEDAMAKSEETAQLLERAQAEKSTGIVITRKKDRSEKLQRDGMKHGNGANVFFYKAMYNRFRFAHFGFLTKTMEFYFVAVIAVAVICRFAVGTSSIVPMVLTLAGLSFFRSLGNPLEQDTGMDYFLMIPESTWKKLFWSLMGGTANCLLDLLLPVIIGALLFGANPLSALLWVPFIVSIDFYATCVGAFIGVSVPVAAGKSIKQIVQVMFVYFGLLPDIGVLALGIGLGHTAAAVAAAAALNVGLGLLFFALSPLFLDPKASRRKMDVTTFSGDWKAARRNFSRLGMGAFVILLVSTILQILAGIFLNSKYPDGGMPPWMIWLYTFAPLYLVAVPLGLRIICRVPAVPREKHDLRFSQVLTAAVISIFMMYAGNLVGILVTSLLQSLAGITSLNPILSYATMEDALGLKILVMSVLAPMIEEYIFRKQMIDRMNQYGEKLSVVTSALLFGLFHGNLSQLFYAFALGLVFGYVYLKTGKLRYSIGLHIFINFLGSVIAPLLLQGISIMDEEALSAMDVLQSPQILLFAAYVICMIGLALAGLVLLCIKSRSICFEQAELELPKGKRFQTVYLNVGMILLIASCLIAIVSMFVV